MTACQIRRTRAFYDGYKTAKEDKDNNQTSDFLIYAVFMLFFFIIRVQLLDETYHLDEGK